MEDWVDVYEGNAVATRDLAAELEASGLHAFVDDREGPIVTQSGGRARLSVVRVPPGESDRARDVVDRWEVANHGQARSLVARFQRIFATSLLPSLIWVLGYWVSPDVFPPLDLGWLLGLFVVSLVAISQIEHRRNRERIPSA